MTDVSRKCALITTSESDAKIAELLLKKDNTHGPMGSGGYSIRKSAECPDGVIKLDFRHMDCTPAPTYFVFIKDGQIWVTYVRNFVMGMLSYAGISFTHEQIDTPTFILEHMESLA